MKYMADERQMLVSASDLSKYAYQRENVSILMQKYGFISERSVCESNKPKTSEKVGRNSDAGLITANGMSGLPVEKEYQYDDFRLTVQGVADRVSFDGTVHTLEKTYTVAKISSGLSPFSNSEYFAEIAVIAAMFLLQNGEDSIKIKMVFRNDSGSNSKSFSADFPLTLLVRLMDALVERALPFIRVYIDGEIHLPEEAKDMPFPYRRIRKGQTEYIQSAYRSIKTGTSLLVSAPTGIGKTISSIYPAVKSIGDGFTDKIFYLTAKTITGNAALDAARKIKKYVPHLRTCIIYSKDQLCPLKKQFKENGRRIDCRFCALCGNSDAGADVKSHPYRERQLMALTSLLSSEDPVYSAERIKDIAASFEVCPHSLALELSEYCSMIVCDYNYVFDDAIRLKQYFKNIKRNDSYVFLIDEAHNLPDRMRDTYSSALTTEIIKELQLLGNDELYDYPDFSGSLNTFIKSIHSVGNLCVEGETFAIDENGEELHCGYSESSELPTALIQSAGDLARILGKYIREHNEVSEALRQPYELLNKFLFCSAYFDEHFRFFAKRENENILAEILCVDPGGLIRNMASSARSCILFSATLSPIDYFKAITGMQNADILELESPYDPGNLCLVSFDAISTKYSDRRGTVSDCARVIHETVSAKEGNYIVYFPSYDYMQRVCKAFARVAENCDLVMQKQGMSYRERERFISLFNGHKSGTLVGFCVLGGMFSEGIDLTGDSLIGAIVVGIGMPQLSAERNIMASYYENKMEQGYNYAYLCPGINKVLQAAGRVIRSDTDRGVIVLIDDRLNDPNVKHLFPLHWRQMRYTGDITSLRALLDAFWDKK